MANSNIKYFKTTFTGIFYSREKTHLPYYKFNNIEWEQIKFPLIENIQELEFYEALEEQTSNSWYQKVLKPYKNFFFSKQWLWLWPKIISTNYFPWIRGVKWNGLTIKRRPHIILPLSDKFQLQENLHEVILKQIEFIDDNGKEWDGGLRRVKGVALFQIHLNPPNKKESAVVEPGKAVDPIPNQAGNIGLENNEAGVTNIWEINKQLQDKAIVSSPDQVPFQMSKKQNRLWLWIILLWLIFCLWKLPVLFFPSLILLGAITFYRFFRRACLSIFISIIIFGILGYFLLNLLPGKVKKKFLGGILLKISINYLMLPVQQVFLSRKLQMQKIISRFKQKTVWNFTINYIHLWKKMILQNYTVLFRSLELKLKKKI